MKPVNTNLRQLPKVVTPPPANTPLTQTLQTMAFDDRYQQQAKEAIRFAKVHDQWGKI